MSKGSVSHAHARTHTPMRRNESTCRTCRNDTADSDRATLLRGSLLGVGRHAGGADPRNPHDLKQALGTYDYKRKRRMHWVTIPNSVTKLENILRAANSILRGWRVAVARGVAAPQHPKGCAETNRICDEMGGFHPLCPLASPRASVSMASDERKRAGVLGPAPNRPAAT